jgi:prepilin signal peptidase PulO-like enzyme (type II secretory pathway)
MDWQFKVGLGVAIVFGLLPFWVKTMPNWVTWPGISIGVLFFLWGWLPNHQKIPNGPAILFIICIAGIVGSFAWYNVAKLSVSAQQPVAIKQPTAEEIASEVVKKLPIETQRAWITVEAVWIEEPFTITKEDSYVELTISIKNYGNVPGTNIMIISQAAAIPIKDGLDFEVAVKKALQVSKNWEEIRHRLGGDILAPTKTLIQHHRLAIPRSEIMSAAQAADDKSRVIICLSGCVDYSFQGGKGQTTFNFVLMEKDSHHMGIEISPRTIPMDKLVLQQEPFGVYAK